MSNLEIIKYPRTSHLFSSGIQKGDSDETFNFPYLANKFLVLESKIDGSNTAISFDDDCNLMLQCRGHYLLGKGDWPQFDPFKAWANCFKNEIFDVLTNKYIMYGEWMSAFHSVFYDKLPHYFIEFDIYDKENKIFLDTPSRHNLLSQCKIRIHSVKVIEAKIYQSLEEIISKLNISSFISENAYKILQDEMKSKGYPEHEQIRLLKLNEARLMEGIYLKWEEDGVTKGRFKYVRPGFTQSIIESEEHWKDRPIIYNKLINGKSLYDIN